MEKTLTVMAALALVPGWAQAADVEVKVEERLIQVLDPDAKVEVLANDIGFGEGPVWMGGDDAFLVFTQMHEKRLAKWSPAEGLGVFLPGCGRINGLAVDAEGSLICCDSSRAQLAKLRSDGKLITLANGIDGKKFNSTNDVAVRGDGTIWFTDPWWWKEPKPGGPDKACVYRFDPKTGELKAVADDNSHPNGICFSPDHNILYVGQSGPGRYIKAYDVQPDGTLANGREVFKVTGNIADGIKCDAVGNIWSSADVGIEIHAPDGKWIGSVRTDPRATNLCFGGPDGRTVFITTKTSLARIRAKVGGVGPQPVRAGRSDDH